MTDFKMSVYHVDVPGARPVDKAVFARAYLAEAAVHGVSLPQDSAAVLSPGVDPAEACEPEPAYMSRRMAEAACRLAVAPCASSGGPMALLVASQVAQGLIDSTSEESWTRALMKHPLSAPAWKRAGASLEGQVSEAWDRVRKHTGLELQSPDIVDSDSANAGAAVLRISVNRGMLTKHSHPSQVLFVVAHELAHIENRHSAAKFGIHEVLEAVHAHPHQPSFQRATTSLEAEREHLEHDMEFVADRRAAQIAVHEGCDPEPILRMVLTFQANKDHPDGLVRAQRVRDVFAAAGRDVSNETWRRLISERPPLKTAPERVMHTKMVIMGHESH